MDEDEEPRSGDERSDAGSQADEEDYDVDEEYDNDYAENYFDNGEGDDLDDLGGGGGDEGGMYSPFIIQSRALTLFRRLRLENHKDAMKQSSTQVMSVREPNESNQKGIVRR